MGVVDLNIGALEVGVLISLFLFGGFSMQVYKYYVQFPEDRRVLKLMVRYNFPCCPDFERSPLKLVSDGERWLRYGKSDRSFTAIVPDSNTRTFGLG